MWFLLYFSLAVAGYGIYTKKGQNAVKMIQIFIETMKNRNVSVKPECDTINLSPVLKYGDVFLNSLNTNHHYDVICFTSDFITETETHNFNPQHVICEKIPLSVLRSGNCLGCIPFRPKDFNYCKFFVGIKRISYENYSIYKFELNDYFNLTDLVIEYENKYETNYNNSSSVLAEAYD